MEENDGDQRNSDERQDKLVTFAENGVVAVESSKAPEKETAKVSAVGDSTKAMEVDGVRHPLQRVEGQLFCPCCHVTTTSEIVMRSHLAGKKHESKMTSTTAGEAGCSKPPITVKVEKAAESCLEPPPKTVKVENAARTTAVAPMETDAPT